MDGCGNGGHLWGPHRREGRKLGLWGGLGMVWSVWKKVAPDGVEGGGGRRAFPASAAPSSTAHGSLFLWDPSGSA